MKTYTRRYMSLFGYDTSSFIPCELCGKQANDLHHIDARGMGGSKEKDETDNLMALCREDHLMYGDKSQYMDMLRVKHVSFVLKNAI